MVKTLRPALAGLALSAVAALPAAWAGGIGNGKTLHGSHCTACHIGMTGGDGSILYTRKDRRVNDLQALDRQVRRCEVSQGLKLSDGDIDDIVLYLNQTYYRFPPP